MFTLEQASFAYAADAENRALKGVDLEIPDGQSVLVCGESGCGKTTLLRLLNGLIPHYYEGLLCGSARLGARELASLELYEVAETVGSVFQNPKAQFFTLDVRSEVAFGCENLGLPVEEIERRIGLAAAGLRIQDLLGRGLFGLSGGEKQKVACASVLACAPSAFVLDEPASNLDSEAIADLHDALLAWKAQGRTVVISEHRLAYLMDVVDRVVCLRGGRIVLDEEAARFRRSSPRRVEALGLRPLSSKLSPAPAPPAAPRPPAPPAAPRPPAPPEGESAPDGSLPACAPSAPCATLVFSNFVFSYPGQRAAALAVEHLELPANQVVGIVGRNAAGKSTFCRCLCGLENPSGSRLGLDGERLDAKARRRSCFMVMQDVNRQLFTESVLEEVLVSLPSPASRSSEQARAVLADLNLEGRCESHPMALSGGERQRLAIATALASRRRVVVFDEPTSGLDFRHMAEVAASLEDLRARGASVFVVTHDPELLCLSCTFILCLERGKVLWASPMGGEALERLERLFDGEGRGLPCAESREFRHGCSPARGRSF